MKVVVRLLIRARRDGAADDDGDPEKKRRDDLKVAMICAQMM